MKQLLENNLDRPNRESFCYFVLIYRPKVFPHLEIETYHNRTLERRPHELDWDRHPPSWALLLR
jgi:hypothetical protein